jgi:hypothetical protein
MLNALPEGGPRIPYVQPLIIKNKFFGLLNLAAIPFVIFSKTGMFFAGLIPCPSVLCSATISETSLASIQQNKLIVCNGEFNVIVYTSDHDIIYELQKGIAGIFGSIRSATNKGVFCRVKHHHVTITTTMSS